METRPRPSTRTILNAPSTLRSYRTAEQHPPRTALQRTTGPTLRNTCREILAPISWPAGRAWLGVRGKIAGSAFEAKLKDTGVPSVVGLQERQMIGPPVELNHSHKDGADLRAGRTQLTLFHAFGCAAPWQLTGYRSHPRRQRGCRTRLAYRPCRLRPLEQRAAVVAETHRICIHRSTL
jgi:hypothetical protein